MTYINHFNINILNMHIVTSAEYEVQAVTREGCGGGKGRHARNRVWRNFLMETKSYCKFQGGIVSHIEGAA